LPCKGSKRPNDRSRTQDDRRTGVTSDGVRDEKARRKQMMIRALIYIVGTHLFAGFVGLLFVVGHR
ncbi:DUF6126 family protein, partial [Kitasatospora griseola]|uniref:DUF6126 family protein n=1 Tax=Kitasatospora griseola TaxID=2064 RepID=UPI001E4FB1B7